MVPRFPWMRVCGVSSCTTVTSQLKLFIQHQVILSHSRGCWSLKCMACRWLYPIMSSKGKPYKYASWVALVPQYDLRAYGQHARHAFRAIGWLMGSLSVLDKSVKEGKERLVMNRRFWGSRWRSWHCLGRLSRNLFFTSCSLLRHQQAIKDAWRCF